MVISSPSHTSITLVLPPVTAVPFTVSCILEQLICAYEALLNSINARQVSASSLLFIWFSFFEISFEEMRLCVSGVVISE
jgi:hypothetical protein